MFDRSGRRVTRHLTAVVLSFAAGLTGWLGASGILLPEPASASHTPDFIGERLEVTQGIQDLKQSVPLVARKRTYVRFYARVSGGPLLQDTNAILIAKNSSGQQKVLLPLSTGAKIRVTPGPPIETTGWWVRTLPSLRSALFELPEGFTEGAVTLTAAVNFNLCFVGPCPPGEHNPNNNIVTRTVSFPTVLGGPDLEAYRIRYDIGSAIHVPAHSHIKQLVSWLRRAYPVPTVQLHDLKTLNWPNFATSVKTEPDGSKTLTSPNCALVNYNLALMFFKFSPSQRRYGMVSDGGGFMRGCAPVPGSVASGPTGSGSYGWDSDGSYGDWYGGHELAHSFGRGHANFCGAQKGPGYPHPDGRISPVSSPGDVSSIVGEMFGFDVQTRAIYPPWWKDNMTYCKNQWIGDFTYKGLRDVFRSLISDQTLIGSAAGLDVSRAGDVFPATFLRVVGSINPRRGRATLGPIFSEEVSEPPATFEPGRYAIVLRGPGGAELARHRLRPLREGPGPPAPWDRQSRDFERLVVMHPVPLPADRAGELRSLHLVAPDDKVLTTVRPGAAPPSLEITEPQRGESYREGPVEVSWEASDPDGDSLTFLVQYRPHAEAEWKSVALPTGRRSASIPFANLPAGEGAAFRVLATDGLHTGLTESEPFTIVNRPPELELVSPREGEVFVGAHEVQIDRVPSLISQPIALEAFAHDADLGVLDGEQLQWSSSIDGFLGTGAELTVDALSAGEHTIAVDADDGNGGVSTAHARITVVDSPEQLPPLPDGLAVEPRELGLAAHNGRDRAPLTIFERNLGSVRWRAAAGKRWLKLSAERGRTPARLGVSLVRSRLPRRGDRARTTVVVRSPDFPERRVRVAVVAELAHCGGMIVNQLGTPGGDVLRGTRNRDTFLLLGGHDVARGRGGNDVICGGPGNDKLHGGPGNDLLLGGPGNDLLVGGAGNDRCKAGPGKDRKRGCERRR